LLVVVGSLWALIGFAFMLQTIAFRESMQTAIVPGLILLGLGTLILQKASR
jgi:hypothetical protein